MSNYFQREKQERKQKKITLLKLKELILQFHSNFIICINI